MNSWPSDLLLLHVSDDDCIPYCKERKRTVWGACLCTETCCTWNRRHWIGFHLHRNIYSRIRDGTLHWMCCILWLKGNAPGKWSRVNGLDERTKIYWKRRRWGTERGNWNCASFRRSSWAPWSSRDMMTIWECQNCTNKFCHWSKALASKSHHRFVTSPQPNPVI